MDYGFNIHIGESFFANAHTTWLDIAPIYIGNHVKIGPNVQIITVNHPLDSIDQRSGIEQGQPISVKDDVWIGAGAIILPGVTIGKGPPLPQVAWLQKMLPLEPSLVETPQQ